LREVTEIILRPTKSLNQKEKTAEIIEQLSLSTVPVYVSLILKLQLIFRKVLNAPDIVALKCCLLINNRQILMLQKVKRLIIYIVWEFCIFIRLPPLLNRFTL